MGILKFGPGALQMATVESSSCTIPQRSISQKLDKNDETPWMSGVKMVPCITARESEIQLGGVEMRVFRTLFRVWQRR